MRLSLGILLVFGFSVTLLGCSASLIPGTRVADTPENREIHTMVETYRLAVEERDPDTIAKLVSRRYYENGSTTDKQADDYGYDHLMNGVLVELKENVKKAQYRIVLRKVMVQGNRAQAEYEYFWRFLYTEGGRDQWVQRNDFNRLDFVREDGSWKIIAGL